MRPAFAFVVALAACSSQPPAPPQQQQPQQPPPSSAQLAEQHIATLRNTRAQQQKFLDGLEAAVAAEPRNEAWAAPKEAELRKFSEATKQVPAGTLQSVSCRSSKCLLRFEVSADARAAIDQRAAINTWVAATQPCAYTIAGTGPVRVLLDCAQRAPATPPPGDAGAR